MKKLMALAAGMLLSFLLIATVNAEPGAGPTPQNENGKVQKTDVKRNSPRITPNDPGKTLDARYKKRIEAKKRAAEMRKQLLNENQQLAPQQK
jgi:hypothetical protein